jgi:DNA-binding NarL/FixJ family response regulator
LEVQIAKARTYSELLARVDAHQDDIILLDWQVAGAQTPALVREILQRNPLLRVVALLPEHQRQYRQLVWDAGACNGIPKEHMDQEWLSTVLCIMHRAMQREARFLEKVAEG